MHRSFPAFLIGLISLTPAIAHADSVFTVKGVLADGGTASGSLTIDQNGYADATPITVLDNGQSYVFGGQFIQLQYGSTSSGGQYVPIYTANGGNNPPNGVGDLVLAFSQTSLLNFTGGALCSTSTPCTNNFAASNFEYYLPALGRVTPPIDFTSLTATPLAAATPEPSSLLLLCTGVAGLAARYRYRVSRT